MWRSRHWLSWNSDLKRRRGLEWMLSPPNYGCRSGAFPTLFNNITSHSPGPGHSMQCRSSIPALSRLSSIGYIHTASASPHHESVSTIDAALCSLPMLTSHIRQFLPMKFVLEQPDGFQGIGGVPWAADNYDKTFITAAEAIERLDADAEVFFREPLQSADMAEPGVSGREVQHDLNSKVVDRKSLHRRQITPEPVTLADSLKHGVADTVVQPVLNLKNAGHRRLHRKKRKDTGCEPVQSVSSIEPGGGDRIREPVLNPKSLGHKAQNIRQRNDLLRQPVQSADSTQPGVSDRMAQHDFISKNLDHNKLHKGQRKDFSRDRFGSADSIKPGVKDRVDRPDLQQKLLEHRRLVTRQTKMETDASIEAAKEYKEMITEMCQKQLAPNLPFVKSLLLSWFEPFRDAIIAEQKAIRNKEFCVDRANYGPYLVQLPADMLAVVAMHRLMGLMMKEHEHGSIRLVRAATVVGEAVEQEIEIYRILNKRKKSKLGGECEVPSAPSTLPDTGEAALQRTVQKMFKQHRFRELEKTLRKAKTCEPWGTIVQAKVGTRLIELMTEVAYVHPPVSQAEQETPEVRQALKHAVKAYSGRTKSQKRMYGVITCDPLVWKSLENSGQCIETPYMPMLVKPRAWEGYSKGGYLVLRTKLMRTHGARSQQIAVARTNKAHLKRVFEALNTLGATPWRINKRLHDIIERIWAEGGRLADLVDRDDVPVPSKPDTEDEVELKLWRRAAFTARRTNCERHSQRCDTELKLSVARKYRDEERFFYPHNLDFRGRAYPMHPYLNHLGSDLCRGLLEFADARPLGSSGLRWLKIHLANLYANGVDKLSFDGRVSFIDENIVNITDSAVHPLEGNRWWLNAEDPFQCLAACFTLRDALESGDVKKFVSHLPVHQDGSCNGLQHYAALGRDRAGAESVNLTKGDVPADVYSGIAVRVKEMMEMDALKDPKTEKTAASAQLLVGQVDRKLVKQTVMTSVYGVTFIGARSQILNRLEERGSNRDNSEMFLASSYAAKTTLTALGEMFKEARLIMAWLADCAKLIACQNEAVRWSTPMGLPVVQPYRKPGWRQIKTSLQVLTLRNDSDQPVVVQRQKSAFPPNFVHSLDSAHMMMTAIACQKAGLRFAGVHDSFWTHAGDVDQMNRLLRETFVELYNQPILENLLKSFQENFPRVNFPPLPKRGDFYLHEVIGATYFFN